MPVSPITMSGAGSAQAKFTTPVEEASTIAIQRLHHALSESIRTASTSADVSRFFPEIRSGMEFALRSNARADALRRVGEELLAEQLTRPLYPPLGKLAQHALLSMKDFAKNEIPPIWLAVEALADFTVFNAVPKAWQTFHPVNEVPGSALNKIEQSRNLALRQAEVKETRHALSLILCAEKYLLQEGLSYNTKFTESFLRRAKAVSANASNVDTLLAKEVWREALTAAEIGNNRSEIETVIEMFDSKNEESWDWSNLTKGVGKRLLTEGLVLLPVLAVAIGQRFDATHVDPLINSRLQAVRRRPLRVTNHEAGHAATALEFAYAMHDAPPIRAEVKAGQTIASYAANIFRVNVTRDPGSATNKFRNLNAEIPPGSFVNVRRSVGVTFDLAPRTFMSTGFQSCNAVIIRTPTNQAFMHYRGPRFRDLTHEPLTTEALRVMGGRKSREESRIILVSNIHPSDYIGSKEGKRDYVLDMRNGVRLPLERTFDWVAPLLRELIKERVGQIQLVAVPISTTSIAVSPGQKSIIAHGMSDLRNVGPEDARKVGYIGTKAAVYSFRPPK